VDDRKIDAEMNRARELTTMNPNLEYYLLVHQELLNESLKRNQYGQRPVRTVRFNFFRQLRSLLFFL
jgi:hypothetical protein